MSDFNSALIYRLLPPHLWEVAKASNFLPYAEVDEKDGFYHLSTVEQVLETAKRYYSDHDRVIAVGLNPDRLGEDLKWEPSRGGALFPHYYGFVPTEMVEHQLWLTQGPEGRFQPGAEAQA